MAFKILPPVDATSVQMPSEPQTLPPAPQQTAAPAPVSTPPEEGALSTLLRGAARMGARGLEGLVGAPGELVGALSALAGGAQELGRRVVGREPTPMEQLGEKATRAVTGVLPTPETIRKRVTEPLTGEYLKPRGESEKFLDEFATDVGRMFLPVGAPLRAGKILKTAAAGSLGSLLAKTVGGDETAQGATKIGAMMLANISRPRKMANMVRNLYRRAEMQLPANAAGPAENIEKALRDANRVVLRGASTPEKTSMRKFISELRDEIRGNEIPIKDAWAFKRDFNKIAGDPATGKGLKKLLRPITHELRESIREYGKDNPAFLKSFQNADDLYKAMNYRSFIHKALKPGKGILGLNPVTTALFTFFKAPKLAGTAVGAGYLEKGIAMLAKSKALRNEYGRVLSAAAKDFGKTATPAVAAAIRDFDREASKEAAKPSGRFRILQSSEKSK